MKACLNGKKANAVADGITILIILLCFGFLMILGYHLLDTTSTEVNSDADMSNMSKQIMTEQSTRYPKYMDAAFMFALVGLWIAALVTAFMIDSHPVFFVISLVLLIAVFVMVAYLGNSYEELMADEPFDSLTPKFPMMHWVMTHMLIFIVVITLSVMLVLYGKNRR